MQAQQAVSVMNPEWIAALSALAVAVVTLGVRIVHRLVRLFSSIQEFLDDWRGSPARPGTPERPGVMTRLALVEDNICEIRAEATPNRGSSLHDIVSRTASDVRTIKQHLGMD